MPQQNNKHGAQMFTLFLKHSENCPIRAAGSSRIYGVADLPIAIHLVAFFPNCGITADRPPSIHPADIHHFLSDLENNEYFFMFG